MLEVTLRKYTCVTVGDVIVLQHAGKMFSMDVLEVRPGGAASIVETDVEIDFDEPLGYQESEYAERERAAKAKVEQNSSSSSANNASIMKPSLQRARLDSGENGSAPKFVPFAGAGKRIDGKGVPTANSESGLQVNQNDLKPVAKPAESSNNTNSSTTAPIPTYQSRIGDKYSKKKTAASAFTGTSYKLA